MTHASIGDPRPQGLDLDRDPLAPLSRKLITIDIPEPETAVAGAPNKDRSRLRAIVVGLGLLHLRQRVDAYDLGIGETRRTVGIDLKEPRFGSRRGLADGQLDRLVSQRLPTHNRNPIALDPKLLDRLEVPSLDPADRLAACTVRPGGKMLSTTGASSPSAKAAETPITWPNASQAT